jgi:hypothetical protein
MEVSRPGRASELVERRIPVAVTAGESVGGGWLPATGAEVVLDPADWRRRVITDIQAQGLYTKSPLRPQGPLTDADLSSIEGGPPAPAEAPEGGAGGVGGSTVEVSGWIEYDDGSDGSL